MAAAPPPGAARPAAKTLRPHQLSGVASKSYSVVCAALGPGTGGQGLDLSQLPTVAGQRLGQKRHPR